MPSTDTTNISYIYLFFTRLSWKVKKESEVSLSFPQAIKAWPNMPTFSLILFLAFSKNTAKTSH